MKHTALIALLPVILSGTCLAQSSFRDDSSPTSVRSETTIISLPSPILVSETDVPDYCKNERFEIRSLADLAPLEECNVVVGDVFINEYKDPILSLSKIENIVGSLIIKKSPELVRIEAPNVVSISKLFSLKELTSLSLISFPSLRSVQTLDWKVLPILSNVHFSNEIKNLDSITVSDTSLTGFSGFLTHQLETLDINNNRFLESISCNVEKITGKLHLAANSAGVTVSLPRLKSANNVSIHEVADLNLGSLEEVGHTMNIINNYFNQVKFPKLKTISGTLSLLKNEKLNQVEFPVATEIGGGLMIVNNTILEKINFLPKLSIIGGALEFVGNIKETSMKQLKLVKGSAKINSLSTTFDCTKWTRSEIGSVIRGGKIECSNGNNQRVSSDTPTGGSGGNNTFPRLRYSSGGNKIEAMLLLVLGAAGLAKLVL